LDREGAENLKYKFRFASKLPAIASTETVQWEYWVFAHSQVVESKWRFGDGDPALGYF